jgi:hypothetical protein
LTDVQFLFGVLIPVVGTVDGKLNIEAMSLAPLFMADDDCRFATRGAKLGPTGGLVGDETPPYALKHVTSAASEYRSSDLSAESISRLPTRAARRVPRLP